MADNQDKDKLDSFFRQSLEGFGAEPSEDFWERLEAAIPPKPDDAGAIWRRRLKWGWLLLPIILLTWGGVLMAGYMAQVEALTAQVESQQQTLTALKEACENRGVQQAGQGDEKPGSREEGTTTFTEESPASGANNPRQASLTAGIGGIAAASKTGQSTIGKGGKNAPSTPISTASPASLSMLESTENQQLNPGENTSSKNTQPQKETEKRVYLPPPALLHFLPPKGLGTTILLTPPNVNSVGLRKNRYPKISFEVGTSLTAQVHGQDTFPTKNASFAWTKGAFANLELNASWMIQTGWASKQVRLGELKGQYAQLPVWIRHRRVRNGWVLSAKTGISLNTLHQSNLGGGALDVASPFAPSFLEMGLGAGVEWGLSRHFSVLMEPIATYSLQPALNEKRVLGGGIYGSVRYRIK